MLILLCLTKVNTFLPQINSLNHEIEKHKFTQKYLHILVGDLTIALTIYRSVIRSKLEYGSVVNGCAKIIFPNR